MSMVQKIEHWGDAHHPKWVDIVRIGLGFIILAKGLSFVHDNGAMTELIRQTNFQLSIWSAVHYVVLSHVVGGIFIIFGFRTRLAVIFQLPILIAAVLFIHVTHDFSFLNSEFWFALAVLVLLVIFLIMGSGKYSLDNLMDRPGYKREI